MFCLANMFPPVIKLHGSGVNRTKISNYTFCILIVNEPIYLNFDAITFIIPKWVCFSDFNFSLVKQYIFV